MYIYKLHASFEFYEIPNSNTRIISYTVGSTVFQIYVD